MTAYYQQSKVQIHYHAELSFIFVNNVFSLFSCSVRYDVHQGFLELSLFIFKKEILS
jgi:hypothetical protein